MPVTRRTLAALALAPLAAAPGAFAQTSPAAAGKSPLRFVIPLGPGSAQDGIVRRLSERMGAVLGQPAVVENKPGASGILATDTVVKSPADGSVLTFTMASTISIAPHTFRKLPYDPLKDLKPVIRVGTTPLLLVVQAGNPARNLAEFLDNARKNPGKVSFGSFGNGTSAHLLGEELNLKANTKLLHVPYKSVSTPDLLGGVLDSAITDFGSIRDFLRPPARLRVLAITGTARNREYPEIPTFGEQGYPSLDPMVGWVGIFAPAGVPDAQVAQLAKDLAGLVDGPEVQQTLRGYGYDSGTLTGDALKRYVQEDYNRWGAIAKAIKLELN
jgi:tripartite-type tricarboxylate transporter receptor subunit TctC